MACEPAWLDQYGKKRMTDDVQRDLGRMEAQITALIWQVSALNTKVDAIDKTLSEARGGWRILLLIGGVAGTVGGVVGKFLPLLNMRPDG
jgi:hypothetical protein